MKKNINKILLIVYSIKKIVICKCVIYCHKGILIHHPFRVVKKILDVYIVTWLHLMCIKN